MTFRWLRVALLPAITLAGEAPTLHTYEGSAYLPDNGTLLYTEEYEVRMREGEPLSARTAYRDSSGKAIAERSLDFSTHPWAPDYRFEDFRSGRAEGAELRDGELRIYSRPSREEPMRMDTLQVPQPVVVDGGFTRFVVDHWDSLAAGDSIAFHFVAVSRLDWFEFEIFAEGTPPEAGDTARVFTIQAVNPLLRLVVPPIHATYDVASRHMLEYRGRSNIRGGKPVRLVYSALTPRGN